MKILWLINIPLPEASILMDKKPIPFGGWLVNASKSLSEQGDVELSVAFPQDGINNITALEGERIKYFAFSPITSKDIDKATETNNLRLIIDLVKPDIVHIFGTEYAHTLAMVNACNLLGINVVIAIQGLVSIYSQHYMAGLPSEVQKMSTLRDLLRRDNLRQQQKKFVERGKYEIEALKRVNHVIGRTTWDKACTSQINPKARYHFCNETLRNEFYNHTWDINTCERYSIFVSQGYYPIKGLHFLIEAMPILLKKFPDAKLYVAGDDFTKSDTVRRKLKISSYGSYANSLIKKYHLQNNLFFTGLLDEEQICERFLKSNVFVSPSIIENESNSLSEAKILGVPCVASYVGGVVDRINHQIDGFLYQHDASYMLAYYICEIFGNTSLALEISKKARENALKIHDIMANTKQLLDIYNNICKQ